MSAKQIISLALATFVILGGGFWFLGKKYTATHEKITVSPREAEPEDEISSISPPPLPIPPSEKHTTSPGKRTLASAASYPEYKSTGNISPTREACQGSEYDRFQCFRTHYRHLVAKKGAEEAILDLKASYDDPFVKSQCHQLVHIIGRAALEKYGDPPAAYLHGDNFCWSGYYHGVMEAVVAKLGSELMTKLDTLCAGIPGKDQYSFAYYNCVHGLGHGFMSITQNELFQSLETCDKLSGAWEESSCWRGVIMENIIADQVNHFSKYLKNDDPLYPCNVLLDKYKEACYLMQTSHMLKLASYDFAKVFGYCRVVEEPYQDTCYQSLGRDASGSTASDTLRTRTYCLLGQDRREQENCIIGAAKDFISYHHSDSQAREFCSSLPIELQRTCLSTVESYYRVF